MSSRLIGPLIAAIVFLIPLAAMAQSPQSPPPAPTPSEPLLKAEELDALAAPIALYPDTLLSLVLMASTYPLEVVQAERWANQNKNLKGDELKAAVDKQAWDESIKSLVATPSVLTMMSTKLDWTQKLGDTVLAQQEDLMDAIQRLRTKAQANDKLKTTKEQRVTVTQVQQKQVIAIEPTDPNTVHVPYYDPGVVYGAWPYPAYPPYYFGYPGYIAGGIVATGIAFGAAYGVARWALAGNVWGGAVNWGNRNIISNRPVNINNINLGNNWQHRPEHRHGVKYNNPRVDQRFGKTPGGRDTRMDFRGRTGDQVLRPGTDRPTAGDRRPNQPATRPSTGDRRPAGQPAAKARPSPATNRSPRDTAFRSPQPRAAAVSHANRGQASLASRAPAARASAARAPAGRASAGPRGGRRSDILLKHDIVLLGHLDNGLGFYRFAYHGSSEPYVGVMAQDVQTVMPSAVVRGHDGYLRVFYDKIGLKFQSYDQWMATGAQIPAIGGVRP